ncbi:MAG: pyrroline-5-carboxylate reductase family protein, partial [Planctomycetota bacterium]
MSQIAILGAGNIGVAIARGLTRAQRCEPEQLILTQRHPREIEGLFVQADNREAVRRAETVVVAVQPQQLDELLD